jgi:hypothetical protein
VFTSFVTVAVNPWLFPTGSEAELGDTETLITAGAPVIVMLAELNLLASATLVALTVTVAGFGTAPGAV